MKVRALLTTGVVVTTVTAPCFAFAAQPTRNIEGAYSSRFLHKVGCNPNDEDKQGKCMNACDDAWIKATQAYNANIDQAKETKKACEAACGC